MFWKKKKNESTLFVHESYDRRSAFRFTPPEKNPVSLRFQEKSLSVTDISAAGLSIDIPDVETGTRISGDIILPNRHLPVTLEIIRIDPPHHCSCAFVDLAPEDAEAIHHYIWITQRRERNEQ